MARCCDPREQLANSITLEYKIGGINNPDSGREVVDTMNQIDGVQRVNFEQGTQKLTIHYDPEKVTQDHLVSTLNSLGHSVLKGYKTLAGQAKNCPVD